MKDKKITLRELREESGKSIADVAKALGMSVYTVYNYEYGNRQIGLVQVLRLSKLFDCSTEEVIKAQLNSCQNAR